MSSPRGVLITCAPPISEYKDVCTAGTVPQSTAQTQHTRVTSHLSHPDYVAVRACPMRRMLLPRQVQGMRYA